MNKKNFFSILLLLIAATAPAQIITSKKEAVKKGVYEKPAAAPTAATTQKTTSVPIKQGNAVVSATPKKTTTQPSTKPATVKPVAKPAAKKTKPKYKINDKEDPDLVVGNSYDDYLPMQMINNAMDFIGVNYRGGGTSKAGMDCSGMVTAVFNIFDLKLPRSSRDMAKVGEKVDKKQVKKGDLVFFRTNGRDTINHVGIVVENDGEEIKFIHSSTQKGVIISSTKEPYYERTFAQANRVL